MKTISQIIVVAAFMVLAVAYLHAQGATAAVSGTVLDDRSLDFRRSCAAGSY